MKDIFTAPFLKEMMQTTANMYRLGWDERNGGNISLMLEEDEVNRRAFLTITTAQNAEKEILNFELYTGIPDSVISDVDIETDFDKFVEDSFEKAVLVRKKIGRI